ncbi:glutathione peroxidase-like [Dendronephthya gigantea]|uniref:glutathione peroxidase-like n=1 Tax=Dendronephthya gigantea TaxID=151771 RepID=UPI00106A1792|nr:glutathione peroxidase-like [Dendronephthya gigantea]
MFHRVSSFIFVAFSLANTVYSREKRSELCFRGETSIHEFRDQDLKGRIVDFNNYRDNIVLLVNVATFCQYTFQYLGLNKLQEKYQRSDRCGLKILAVPCNQFAHQEPGNNAEEIFNGLKYVRPGRGFEPQMLMMKKRDVNGKNEDSLYTWLKASCPSPSPEINEKSDIYYSPVRNDDISWNFEKILLDHKGQPRKRYTSAVEPEELVSDIEELIDMCLPEDS